MATNPPMPPSPPAPPRSGGNWVLIALLIVAIIVIGSVAAMYTGLRILSHSVHVKVSESAGENKNVSIQTPVGDMTVRKNEEVSEASLGLPIYPGATRVPHDDAANVHMNILGKQNMGIVVAKFETPDSFDKVEEFYRQRLGNSVTKFKHKDDEGKTVFEIKSSAQDKVVALKQQGSGTRIDLVRIQHGESEAN